MTTYWTRVACAVAVTALLMASVATAADTAAAASRKAAEAAVQQAIVSLDKEYATYAKAPKDQHLREASSYFTENPSADLTPAVILGALGRGIKRDASEDAYIKWQLLSGAPGKFDGPMAKQALAIYRHGPLPQRNPALDHAPLDTLVAGLGSRGQGHEEELGSKLADAVAPVTAYNAPILAYRNELYSRLPTSPDTFAAGLEDVAMRVQHGIQADKLMNIVRADIIQWSVDAKPQQLHAVSGALRKLLALASTQATYVYTTVQYDPKKAVLVWSYTGCIDGGSLDALATSLDQAAANPNDVGIKKQQ